MSFLHRTSLAASALWYGKAGAFKVVLSKQSRPSTQRDTSRSTSSLPGASAGLFCRQLFMQGQPNAAPLEQFFWFNQACFDQKRGFCCLPAFAACRAEAEGCSGVRAPAVLREAHSFETRTTQLTQVGCSLTVFRHEQPRTDKIRSHSTFLSASRAEQLGP